jgi:hypothetical protein
MLCYRGVSGYCVLASSLPLLSPRPLPVRGVGRIERDTLTFVGCPHVTWWMRLKKCRAGNAEVSE